MNLPINDATGFIPGEPSHLDGHTVCDFPFDQVCRDLAGEQGLDETDFEKLSFALRSLFAWTLKGINLSRADARQQIGTRFLAAIWATNPALIEGSPSLRGLARKLDISAFPLASASGDFSRAFGNFRTRGQAHAKGVYIKAPPERS